MAAGGMKLNGVVLGGGGGGGGVSGGDGGGEGEGVMLTEDMMFKLSKKIAQLTKVIYSLNTKNDDLEYDMEALRIGYEDKLQKVGIVPRQLLR